jgi:hypothetical protein
MRLTIYHLLAVLLGLWPVQFAFAADRGRINAGLEGKIQPAVGEILPPFGLDWGVEARVVEDAVKAAGGHVSERQPCGPAQERWTVDGIAQEGLQRVLFSFTGARLSGVELQYGKEDWDTKTFDNFMLEVRASLAAEHGEGRLLVRERKPDAGVLKTTLGYAWSGRTQSVALIYFSAQDKRNLFRLISLHYAGRPKQPARQLASRS